MENYLSQDFKNYIINGQRLTEGAGFKAGK